VDALLRRLLRAAMRRGMAGDWTWLVIAASAYVLRRALRDRGGVVSTLRVSPGEQILISVREYNALPAEAESVVISVDED
jgi:hypothetical protein